MDIIPSLVSETVLEILGGWEEVLKPDTSMEMGGAWLLLMMLSPSFSQ
jgi:hypothetical protein